MNRSFAARAIGGLAFATAVTVGAERSAFASTPIALLNGWAQSSYGRAPAYTVLNGILYLQGAMYTNGTNAWAFTLPAGVCPNHNVYLLVNTWGSTTGRLVIDSSTCAVYVQPELKFSDAAAFTSLDGVSFALGTTSSIPMPLNTGWTGGPFGTAQPSAYVVDGIVHLAGGLTGNGANIYPFQYPMPAATIPATTVQLPIDTYDATTSIAWIDANGDMWVHDANSSTSSNPNSFAFTSLDGVSYAVADLSTPLGLVDGWKQYSGNSFSPSAQIINGAVRLQGAIMQTSGTNPVPFRLPPEMAPSADVWISATLCSGWLNPSWTAFGRIWIQHDGSVTVQADGPYADAQCFTGLDGIEFQQ